MSKYFNSLKGLLLLLVAVCVAGFGLLFLQGQHALRSVEQAAIQMGDGKDIVADILPPPLYIIETHLIAYQLLDVPLEERAPIAQKLEQLRADYSARNTYWNDKRSEIDAGAGQSLLGLQKEKGEAYWNTLEGSFLPLVLAGNDNEARMVFGELKQLYEAHRGGVDKTVTAATGWADARLADLSATAERTLWILAAVGVLCVGLAIALYATVSRRIGRMVGGEPAYAMEVAQRIAEGQLDQEVHVSPGDATSVVARMAQARESVRKLVVGMQEMSSAHDRGDIDAVVPVAEFSGDYAKMASGVNTMVNGHIAVKKKAMACVGEFGRGNFEAPLEKFPGKKAFINDTIEKVREHLKALIADADMLAKAAVAGQLDARADAQHHEGDFRRIVEGVNATLDAVVGPINEVKRVMVGLADGDLTQKIDGTYAGDFQVLQSAVNSSIEKLNDLISGIKGTADLINTAAKEISAGNTNLSQRTEEQASSLEETASSMEELTSTVKQNADNARQANQMAHGASDVATKGGEKVREVVVTMSAITDSSRKISDIISVIDGIAFQTNILALNAAVEAARAGEQGRGFAVVAGEVRTLAQRSAAAAKEIKTLINHSVETVEGGSKLVEQAGSTMDEIVAAVKRVTDIMSEISAASDEQSQGIEQVSTAVAQMDEVTQQNAALVEESAASASSLEDQAHGLAESVSLFRIDGAQQVAAPRKVASVAPAAKVTKAAPAKAVSATRAAPKLAAAAADDEWAEF